MAVGRAADRSVERPIVSREFIVAARRASFVAAVAELADEFGIWDISVTLLCRLGHAARSTFYAVFDGVDDCMRFASAAGYRLLFGPVERALVAPGAREPRARAAIGEMCEAAASDPPLARFLLLHAPGLRIGADEPGPEAGVALLAQLLAAREGADAEPSARDQAAAGAYLHVLATRLRRHETDGLAGLGDELAATLPTPDPAWSDASHPLLR